MSLENFKRRIHIRARKVQEGSDKLTIRVALAVDQAVVAGTPVDTGRARSNWVADINSTPDSILEPYAPGTGGSTGASNTQQALDQAEGVIKQYRTGDEIHITNNLDYIEALNKGHSPQADAGFVEDAIKVASQIVAFGKVVDGG